MDGSKIFTALFLLTEVYSKAPLCNVPEGFPNARIVTDIDNMAHFSHGFLVEYKCDPGYSMINSDGRSTCDSGHWTLVECILYSKAPLCNVPEGFPNARIVTDIDNMAHFSHGFLVEYKCDPGYSMINSDGRSTCDSGHWTLVECIRGCTKIPNADLYNIDKDGIMEKEPVTFVKNGQLVWIQCKEHFTLYKDGAFYETDGISSRCDVGSWRPAYSCKKDSCSIQVPDNGYLEINGARQKDTIKIDSGFEGSIVCEEGFTFYDNDRQEVFEYFPVTCVGHTLNATIPNCVEGISCKWLPAPDHGKRLDSNSYMGNTTQFACNEGYRLIGYEYLLCRADGYWRPSQPPVCQPVNCGPLPTPVNGNAFQATRNGNANIYGHVVKFSCEFGYDLIKGSKERRCQADGTWSGTQPVCEEPSCPDFDPVYNGQVYYNNDEKNAIFDVAEIECNEGSDVFPENTQYVRCIDKNTWDINNITCERHLTIPPPSNMKLYKVQGRYRLRITSPTRFKSRTWLYVECEYKHELFDDQTNTYYDDNRVQVRIFNGTVTQALPTCRKERCNLEAKDCSYMDTNGNKLVGKVDHDTVVVKKCNSNFEFELSNKQNEPSQTSTCNQGVIYFPRCIPKRCEIPADRRAKLSGRYNNFNAGDLIDNEGMVEITCEARKELYYPETQTYEENSKIFTSTCRTGVWSNNIFPICREKRCNLVADDCSYMDTDGNTLVGKVDHDTMVVKKCDPNFEFKPLNKRNEPSQTSTCNQGVIYFPRCIPKRCEIPADRRAKLSGRYNYFNAGDLIDNEEIVEITCEDGKELYYPETQTYEKNSEIFTSTCRTGVWSNNIFPRCKEKRCTSPSDKDGTRFLLNGKSIITGTKLEHGTILTKSCNQGYEDITNSSTECSSGRWIGDEPCKGKPCTLPAIEHTEENEKSKQLAHNKRAKVKCSYGYEMMNSDVEIKKIRPKCHLGNLKPSLDDIKCVPTTVFATKDATISSTTTDAPLSSTTSFSESPVTTEDGVDYDFDYPGVNEIKSEEACPDPANGRMVNHYLYYYNVVCADGYELVVLENDVDYKCSNGSWISKNFGWEPECKELTCDITDEILAVMKVFKRVQGNEMYVSDVRDEIKPDQKYYFECKQENHEPVKRLFTCSGGNWTAAERDPNWKMQIDKMEPTCRKAVCDPACQFGGTCVKDGMCKCVPGTKGKACEIPVCNTACTTNGGKCEAPNTCKCEEPRYGTNCEQVGCGRPDLPEGVRMKETKNFFKVGDVLSSDQLTCSLGYVLSNTTRCTGNHTWSGKAECLKETHYELEVKVGSRKWAGSYGSLYVTILSAEDGIIHRMAFEKPQFKGLYPGRSYTLSSSTTGQTDKVDQLKLLLGPDNNKENDNLEIDHVRLTLQRAANNIIEDYTFSNVGWLDKDMPKFVRPDTGCLPPANVKFYAKKPTYKTGDVIQKSNVICSHPSVESTTCLQTGKWSSELWCRKAAVFRLKYRLRDNINAGSGDTLHISFEGNLGLTPFYLMSSGRRNRGETYYKDIDGGYVGQIHTVNMTKESVNPWSNNMQIDYIKLTVSHEDKQEEYMLRNVGWIGSRKEIWPEKTADQPERPSCQDDFDVSPGWVDRNLPRHNYDSERFVKSNEECTNLCKEDGSCKVAAVNGIVNKTPLTCTIVYTNQESAFISGNDVSSNRLYKRKC